LGRDFGSMQWVQQNLSNPGWLWQAAQRFLQQQLWWPMYIQQFLLRDVLEKVEAMLGQVTESDNVGSYWTNATQFVRTIWVMLTACQHARCFQVKRFISCLCQIAVRTARERTMMLCRCNRN